MCFLFCSCVSLKHFKTGCGSGKVFLDRAGPRLFLPPPSATVPDTWQWLGRAGTEGFFASIFLVIVVVPI